MVADAAALERGRYLFMSRGCGDCHAASGAGRACIVCIGCHGDSLSGGRIPGGPPDWPAASNLTPGQGTVMSVYDSVEKFKAMFRSGKRPDGSAVAVMPFDTLREVNDTDVSALYAYLKQLPPRRAGGR